MHKESMLTVLVVLLTLAVAPLRARAAPSPGHLIAQNIPHPQTADLAHDLVQVEGNHFVVDGQLYAFVGANLWYGANLGADDDSGDRPRLVRELDRLALLGVRNLRVMAGSEGPDSAPYRIVPALQTAPHEYNAVVLGGLDFLLNEMGKRHMRAVLCLSNYWHWSGGLAQYVSWNGGGPIPYPPPAAGGDWDRYKEYTEQFYTNAGARADYARHVRYLLTRTNSITGIKYADDPTIMTWELANEPAASTHVDAYVDWIKASARLIKTLDPHHLVISGGDDPTLAEVNELADIDYATVHIWVQNNGWYDPLHPEQTYQSAAERAQGVLQDRRQTMQKLGKPLVLAEFGLARDNGAVETGTPTTYRDDFYGLLMGQSYRAAREDQSIAGVSFWAWSGEGRARIPGGRWQRGDALIGDPPHEPQGWYGVYDEDESTLRLIHAYAMKMEALAHRSRAR